MRDIAEAPLPVRALQPLLPLRAERLSLRIGRNILIDSLDLELADGGVTMVMGPSGAGKSLLLNLMHGLMAPTDGRVTWAGAPVSDGIRRQQALVFQKAVLLRRSVAANLDFVLRARSRRDRARRDALLDHVGLLDRARQPARLLSGGEQQRLALARALALEPAVLLLDEPTASLDPASVLMIERIVGEARDAGTKVIFVTHDVAQARRLADDVAFIHKGRLAEHAPAASFFSGPATRVARDYLDGRLVV